MPLELIPNGTAIADATGLTFALQFPGGGYRQVLAMRSIFTERLKNDAPQKCIEYFEAHKTTFRDIANRKIEAGYHEGVIVLKDEDAESLPHAK